MLRLGFGVYFGLFGVVNMRAWTCFTCCSLCLKRRVDGYVVSWHLSTFRIMLLTTCFLQGYHPRSTQRSVLCSWWQAIDGSCCSTYDKFYQIFYLMADVLFEHRSNVDTLKKFCKGEMNPAKSVVFPNWMIRDWCMSHFFLHSLESKFETSDPETLVETAE